MFMMALNVKHEVLYCVFIKLTDTFVILVFSCWPSWIVRLRVLLMCWVALACKQKYVIPCLNILYIQIKIYFLSILHISLQIQYDLNLKIRKDRNHYRHTSSVHKTYRHICYSCVQLLTKLNCEIARVCEMLCGTCLQTKIRNSMLKCFVHPDQNLFAFHTPYIATDPVRSELENSRGL